MHTVFAEFALLLLIAAVVGAVALRLRQPLLIAYILVGILVGPTVQKSGAAQPVDLLAHVGVAVLLFAVGLKLDLRHVRHIGPVALATGLGQLAFTISIGFVLVLLLGRPMMEALYVAVALTFSSTIIVVKLLSDKRELEALHGRIAVGFLIVQDLAVVVAMMAMSTMAGDTSATAWQETLLLLSKLTALALGIWILMRWLIGPLVTVMARSQELLLIFAIAWGTCLAAFGEWAGFSREAGAFLAGFSLASTHYRDAINARLNGIRDFLLLFFFINLGAGMDLSTLGDAVVPAVALSAFVLIGNPLIVMAIMGFMGYRKRTGFLAGLTVAQISEFSIIFVAMGITLGHVDEQALGLTTLVGLITIALSTYMILYSHALYDRLAPLLGIFERADPWRELDPMAEEGVEKRPEVLVFGLGRYGFRLSMGLRQAGLRVVGVDFDPEIVAAARRRGLDARFGDGMESEFLDSLPLHGELWVVSTFPDLQSNEGLIHALREQDFDGELAVVARTESEGAALRVRGVETVLLPLRDAVDYAIENLTDLIRASSATKAGEAASD